MPTLSERLAGSGRAGLRAVLGPTNTGKTHLALERMLLHRTGTIGLPLRLLAREVYDRLVARAGAGAVSLITGEEKIKPPGARYSVCTVEAMPLDRPVHFLAVDEIQLAAHRTRGHVFTDRLLRARGVDETLFLGSDTMAPVLDQLLPGIDISAQPRLSELRHVGYSKLRSVPPRSAVVAFSAAQVYLHAERLRARHGGCAVVLGALSPRTRNAQVELYQSGAVDYIVATDAIGMGLNLDVRHVAFADTQKFDGRNHRCLRDDELAQIAGRAGRYTQDGTFGTTGESPELSPDTIAAIEQHRFEPVRWVWWRNHQLDFSSPQALLGTLEAPAPASVLKRMADAEDHRTLQSLIELDGVRERLAGEEDLRLLWEVAQIPDYRQSLTAHHAELLMEIYASLHELGRLPEPWVQERLSRLDRTEGDIDALMARIAFVRTWTYVSHRTSWLDDPEGLQERARALEDRLSDALHEQLTVRFVDHRLASEVPGLPTPSAQVDSGGTLHVGGVVRGRLVGLELTDLRAGEGSPLASSVRRAASAALRDRVRALAEDPDEAFEVSEGGEISWRGDLIGSWQPGPELAQPRLRLRHLPDLDPLAIAVVRDRLTRYTDARIAGLLGSLRRRPGRELPPAGLDILLAVEAGLGTAPISEIAHALNGLDSEDHKRLAKLDLRVGKCVIYLSGALKPAARALRAILWRVGHGSAPSPPPDGATSLAISGPEDFYWAVGFPVVGGVAVRADVLERVYALVRRVGRAGPFGLPQEVPSWLGSDREIAGQVLSGLGYQKVSTEVEPRFVPPPRPQRAGPRRRRR